MAAGKDCSKDKQPTRIWSSMQKQGSWYLLIYFLDLSGACFCGLACWNCGPKPLGFQVHCQTKKPTPSVPTNHQSRSQYGASLVSLSDHWITHPRHLWFTSVLPKSWNLYWNTSNDVKWAVSDTCRSVLVTVTGISSSCVMIRPNEPVTETSTIDRPINRPSFWPILTPYLHLTSPCCVASSTCYIYVRQQQQSLLAGSSPES